MKQSRCRYTCRALPVVLGAVLCSLRVPSRAQPAVAALTVEQSMGTAGRIFYAGKAPLSLAATLHNHRARCVVAVKWLLSTQSGHKLAGYESRATMPRGSIVVHHTFAPVPPGLYKLTVKVTPVGSAARGSAGAGSSGSAGSVAALAVVARPAAPAKGTAHLHFTTYLTGSGATGAAANATTARLGLHPLAYSLKVGSSAAVELPLVSDAPETSAANRATLVAARGPGVKQWKEVRLLAGTDKGAAAAGALISRAATALGAGCTDLSAVFGSASHFDAGNMATLSALVAWSRLVHHLHNARSEGNMFGSAPLLRGTSFSRPGGRSALIWAERNDNPHARMVVPLRAAKAYDLWGNRVAQASHGRLVIALGATPVYVLSAVPGKQWSQAWRAASLQGLRPLAAQVLPLTQLPTGNAPSGRTPSGRTGTRPQLAVRLQNISLTPFKGTISVSPPPGWSLVVNHVAIELNAGQSRVYSFKCALAPRHPSGLYSVTVRAQRGASHWQWQQNARVAVAQHTRTVNIDGRLGDWADAAWMTATLPRPGHASRAVRLALYYDDAYLYVAARVAQSRLRVRPGGEGDYRFWSGNDCIELVFSPGQPSAAFMGGANDTHYGFLLSPFGQSGGRIEGRVLRLWGGSTPFAMSRVADHTRWGGAVSGARCFIGRDEAKGETLYEAELPLSQIGWLRPRRRAADNSTINFSWKVFDHSDQSSSWGRATGVFAWRAGSGSFWPPSRAYLAAQTPLGFAVASPLGRLQMPELLPLPAVPRPAPSHSLPFVLPPQVRPGAGTAPPPFELPPLAPMAPSSLPAAAPVAVGTPLPPVLPAAPDGG